MYVRVQLRVQGDVVVDVVVCPDLVHQVLLEDQTLEVPVDDTEAGVVGLTGRGCNEGRFQVGPDVVKTRREGQGAR